MSVLLAIMRYSGPEAENQIYGIKLRFINCNVSYIRTEQQ
jgi:hypothetical protein